MNPAGATSGDAKLFLAVLESTLRTELRRYDTPHALAFWGALGYQTLRQPLPAAEFEELPAGAREPLREAFLLYNDNALRIYHLHLHNSQRGKLRRLLEALQRRYPQYECLFTARAADSPNLLFIHPCPVLKDDARLTLAIRTLEVQPDNPTRTDLETLLALQTTPTEDPSARIERIREAFSVEKVTEKFYQDFRRLFEEAEALITGVPAGEPKRLFTLKLFNRLLFVRFLERKGWLRFDKRRDYLRALWEDYRANRADDDTFYNACLKPLFFGALNNPQQRNLMGINQGGLLRSLVGEVPYLNGGLFEQRDDDITAHVPDAALQPVLEGLLYRYNFTITESTPLEIEVAVDPEMLGKVFEELVTGRHETGSYYTPRPVVAFMCREALKGYLQTATKETPEAVAAFVDQRDASQLRDPEAVLDALRRVRVCDPACGSGAYLLGMLHELLELRATLFEQKHLDPRTLYERKLEIIQRNLYGVDTDAFAVEIARLRLWLSLVVDDTRNPLDDPNVDVSLPNLDFKIEQGDSLLAPDPQGGQQPDMFRQQQIEEYERLKADYMRAHSDEHKRLLREQIETLRAEIRQWAHPHGDVEGFDWRVEFAEVFKEGGFDIIVANPPYVRQELIDSKVKEKLLKQYAEAAVGRSDLYVYFYARALQLLKPGGMHVFVCSNSWLDVGFGGKLQEYLLKRAHIQAIYDSALERQFASADVNTIISVLQKDGHAPGQDARITRFVRLNAPFEQAVADPQYQRVITRTAAELWQAGLNEQGVYEGDKWGGKYLRAPDIYFTILEKGKGKLVRLGDIAEVRRGFTTGANEFFYLEPVDCRVADVVAGKVGATVRVKNGAGWQGEIETDWLRPVIKSPRELKTLRVRPEDLRYLVFMPPDAIRKKLSLLAVSGELKKRYPKAWAYIQWGEKQGYHKRSTCASRQRWWDLGESRSGLIAWAMIHALRHNVHHNPVRSELDHNFFEVVLSNQNLAEVLAAVCGATTTVLIKELFGRSYGGGSGPIKNEGTDIAEFLIPNPAALTASQRERLLAAFEQLAGREVKSIFEELGLPKPNRDYSNIRPEEVSLEKVLPDRRALDSVVFEVLGLSEAEQLEVYRAVVELVKNRLVKAQSVG
ncbi:MAG: BREX-1 system adenine-specific DNA-methyltransferase PglX [Fimbriimonadales bacterium]|nr:BREX-1 system adenine-specific DNA-methyltransferase PglX [Fimbriimonadales bacterium]